MYMYMYTYNIKGRQIKNLANLYMPMMLSIQIAKFNFRQYPTESHFTKFNTHPSYPLYGIP